MKKWKHIVAPADGNGLSWYVFPDPRPYVTVSGFAFDKEGNFPILHRSKNVRSAANAWALPSGLHEAGIPAARQFKVELQEELSVLCDQFSAEFIGNYENIRPDKDDTGWHWFITVMAVRADLSTLENLEPDKHDEVKIMNVFKDEWTKLDWEPALKRFVYASYQEVIRTATKIVSLA